MIKNVERVERNSKRGDILLLVRLWFEHEFVSQVEIEIDQAGAVESVARIAEGAIIYDAVAVVVCAGGDVYGLAGIEREGCAESEKICEMR